MLDGFFDALQREADDRNNREEEYRQAAEELKMLYDAFIFVGFDEEQALTLLVELMARR